MPLISTRGAASAQGFGEFAQSAAPVYIEDVFSTYLIKPAADFTTYSINNGIDLLGEGGMTWFKARDAAQNNLVYDTVRGSSSGNANALITNGTQAQQTTFFDFVTPNANGFTVNFASGGGQLTNSGINYASWTFREQAKFFDIVTFTAPAVGVTTTVSHSLGSTPGCIIMKSTTNTANWVVLHRYDQTMFGELNTTAAFQSAGFNANFTATSFDVKGGFNITANSGTYVAYLFAHNAGGFGLSGADNVISCGSYTGNGSSTGPVITLGWEPQWVLIKNASDVGNWVMSDNMRNWSVTNAALLYANLSNAEATNTNTKPTATGFQPNDTSSSVNTNGATYIYIAIRRGPMKVPTSGTQIANPKGLVTLTSGQTVTTGFVTDMTMAKFNGTQEWLLSDRLRNTVLYPNTTDSEGALYGTAGPRPFDVQDGFKTSGIGGSYALWGFRRAPGFFDVVCYTGTGVARTINHNLAAVPELMIVKTRSATNAWAVYAQPLGNTGLVYLNWDFAAATGQTLWNSTTPTASTFSVNASATVVNQNNTTYVAYLFATVAGVSKVGSYTGSGTTKQIDCGFTGGARLVLIKRTDSTGNWHLYDSGQGIVAGNDPYFLVNTSDGQYVGSDYVDTYSAGFELSSTAPAGLNANGGTYIFLAIA